MFMDIIIQVYYLKLSFIELKMLIYFINDHFELIIMSFVIIKFIFKTLIMILKLMIIMLII